jgi:hypothetical protein
MSDFLNRHCFHVACASAKGFSGAPLLQPAMAQDTCGQRS